jgi:cell wall-associated NlpC family hydrolase
MAPERTPPTPGTNLPSVREADAAMAVARESMLAQPPAGREEPSGEEVRRRLSSLYDHAENATGNFNGTRALANSTRKSERRGGGQGRRDVDPAQAELMRQWFDGARSRLGPSLPARLPTDRQPDRGRETARPAPTGSRPADGPTTYQVEQAARPVAELTAAPARELTAGPAPELTARPVLELTAGSANEMTAGRAPAAARPEAAVRAALPTASAPAAAPQTSPLQVKKASARRKLGVAQELLSRHMARQNMPAVPAPAIEYRPVAEEPRLTSFESAPLPPWAVPAPTPFAPGPLPTGFESAPLPPSFAPTSFEPAPVLPSFAPTPAPTPFESVPLPTAFPPAPVLPSFVPAAAPVAFEAAPPVDEAWRQPWPAGSGGSWPAAPAPADPNPGFSIDRLTRAGAGGGTGGSVGGSAAVGSPPVVAYDSRAAQAVAFARAQIGMPCVWGASGPGSYDPSGLTQAAWKSAGVLLPRATQDQARVGTVIALPGIQPGDLVLFHGNVSHVGLYVGDGVMVHAPSPGARIAEESIHYAGQGTIHSVVRPA